MRLDLILLVIGVFLVALVGVLAKIRMLVQVGVGAVALAAVLKYWEFTGVRPSYADIMLGYLVAAVTGYVSGFLVSRRGSRRVM